MDLAPPPASYHLFNFYLGGTFKGKKNEPQLRLGIENLTNTRYRNYLDRQRYFADAIGRNFILSWVQYF